jgi:hypothetical protein
MGVRNLCVALMLVSGFLLATSSWATDGVLEINQTCAVETGCFPGDDPGFPITITRSGSYRLTSSLGRVTTGDLSGSFMWVEASHVTLDMAGFQISCTPLVLGATRCAGGATGIYGVPDADNVVVRNGTIRGLPQEGLRIDGTGIAEKVRAFDNGGIGILVSDGLIIESIARGNGGTGIRVDTGTVDGCWALDNAPFADISGAIRNSTYRNANILGDLGGNLDLP